MSHVVVIKQHSPKPPCRVEGTLGFIVVDQDGRGSRALTPLRPHWQTEQRERVR